jgi:hypothetical protein
VGGSSGEGAFSTEEEATGGEGEVYSVSDAVEGEVMGGVDPYVAEKAGGMVETVGASSSMVGNCLPHFWQKMAPAWFSAPQWTQYIGVLLLDVF